MDDAWLLNSMTVEQLKVTCSSLQRSHGDMQVLLQEFQVEQVLLRREQERLHQTVDRVTAEAERREQVEEQSIIWSVMSEVDKKLEAPRLAPAGLLPELARQVVDLLGFPYRVATSGGGGPPTIWGPRGARRELRGHLAAVNGIRLFPFSDRALTWGDDGVAILWNATSGEAIHYLRHLSKVKSGRIFPSGDHIVTRTGRGEMTVWDVASGARWRRLPAAVAAASSGPASWRHLDGGVEVFPCGARVLAWGRETVARVWDVVSDIEVCRFRGHTDSIRAAAVFPSGDRVVTGGFDWRAFVWDAASCQALQELANLDIERIMGVAVLAGGSEVATSGTHGTGVWDTASGKEARFLVEPAPMRMQHDTGVESFPDGHRLLTWNPAEAIVWNASAGEALHRLVMFPADTESAAVAPGGDVVVTCGSGILAIWDAASGAELHAFDLRDPADRAAGGGGVSVRRNGVSVGDCSVAVELVGAVDPHGVGRGAPWRALPEVHRE